MDGMDMSDMGGMGMDMGSSMFRTTDEAFSHDFWFIIAALTACIFLFKALTWAEAIWRIRIAKSQPSSNPSRPSNPLRQSLATTTALFRELAHPRLWLIRRRSLDFLNPPPLGRVLILFAYWAVIIYMLVSGAIVVDAYFWERIGYRAAWISIMQVPLLYLLSAKCSLLGYLIGASHERLNWLHRWVGRTILITATIHGFHFYTEWAQADLVQLEMEMMSSIVPYGFGAWAVLLWTLVVSVAPLRRLAYEVFVAQHIASAAAFLWLLYVHVPKYARYYVWFAIGAWASDRLGRLILFICVNYTPVLRTRSSKGCRCQSASKRPWFGHAADVRAVDDQVTVISVHHTISRWRPGQHFYVWMPRLGLLETHPYTVMCTSACGCGLQFVVRKHGGFSKRLHDFGLKNPGGSSATTALVTGPYGSPAAWHTFATLVLISGSTGASFTLSILQGVLDSSRVTCNRNVEVLCLARTKSELDFYEGQIRRLARESGRTSLCIQVRLVLTGGGDPRDDASVESHEAVEKHADEETGLGDDGVQCCTRPGATGHEGGGADLDVSFQRSRPDLEELIRRPVEQARGETSVVVCGGGSLTSRVRNVVSRLSDERAVHKGSGAQGIHLHVEEYSF
ncbi:hypothetical protein F5X68DRAFT_272775 [Plectosphaerella plurivora]|uniref:ferric-chelate reductase (NADPH) n=1 Tax=Plectosphaerella plurivora TaxID=936078 RepID=A0A9P8VKX2_9PEZI|nr:hypothetical protein F5X68DRAFT_272775 [Plectosphaerella plurivora]